MSEFVMVRRCDVEEALEVLEAARAYIERNADVVDGPDGLPAPNPAMALAARLASCAIPIRPVPPLPYLKRDDDVVRFLEDLARGSDRDARNARSFLLESLKSAGALTFGPGPGNTWTTTIDRLAAANVFRAIADAVAPAPVSPPAVAKRERRTAWFMENNAGLWMGADMGSHTRDPNAAAQFATREACEAACERDRATGPHPGVRVYRPTEHIFFGDDDVAAPVSPPAPRGEAVAWAMVNECGKPRIVSAVEANVRADFETFGYAQRGYRIVALVPKEAT